MPKIVKHIFYLIKLYRKAILRGTILFIFLFNMDRTFSSLLDHLHNFGHRYTPLELTILIVEAILLVTKSTILIALIYGPIREHLFIIKDSKKNL